MRRLVWLLAFVTLASAASITLNFPADNQVLGTAVSFSFTPTAETGYEHCTLFSNKTGSWALTQANLSLVTNASSNTLTHTLSEGSVLWQVTCSANLTEFSSSNRTVRTDATAPSAILNLSATSAGSQVNVSWNASTDSTSLFYAVSRNGTWIANRTVLQFNDENVTAGQSYLYAVRAVDQANLSSSSASVTFHVPAASATPAPLTISNIAVTLSSSPNSSSATFAWNVTATSANATISYGNTTSLFGVVSNPTLASSHSLTVAGLSPMRAYVANITSCNATACGYNTSLSFFTLPSSTPSGTTHTANSSVGGNWVLFTVPFTDAAGLSYYLFSSNATGSFVNTTPVAFTGGSSANHSMLLNSNAYTLSWQMWANNSQGAWGTTQVWNHAVSAPVTVTPTPLPTIPAALVPTPIPTAPPALTPTPAPVVQATSSTPTPVPEGAKNDSSAALVLNQSDLLNGTMNEFVLVSPENASVALSPTGLVVGVDTLEAPLRFSTNFTNLGIPTEILFVVNLSGPDLQVSLSSPAANVTQGEQIFLQTKGADLPSGTYRAVGSVVDVSSGKVLDTKALVVNVESSATSAESAAISGLMVALLGVSVLILFQLQSALQLKEKR